MGLASISACILVKDESELLVGCLESICEHVDEVIVVNDGSCDDSGPVARAYGCTVIDFQQQELDEGTKRNVYLKAATGSWILVLDADERMDNVGLSEIRRAVANANDSTLGVYLPRLEYIGHGKWASTQILRLFRNQRDIQYDPSVVHASVGASIDRLCGTFQRNIYAPIHHLDILLKSRTAKKRDIYRSRILKALDTNQDPTLYTFLGNELAILGRFREADEAFRLAINTAEIVNEKARAVLYLAQMYLHQGDLRSAKSQLTDLLVLNSSFNMQAYTTLAEISIRESDPSNALYFCEEGLKTGVVAPHLNLNIGCLLEGEKPSEAIKYLNRAIKLNPYLSNGIIYKEGEMPNLFYQQNVVLSCVQLVYRHLATAWKNEGNILEADRWEQMADRLTESP